MLQPGIAFYTATPALALQGLGLRGLRAGQPGAPGADDESRLTDREREMLRLADAGRKGYEIAAEMKLGRQTIRNYFSDLYVKLGVANCREAIAWARERGQL
jgi:DNA-binding CsgD family transcriptional regulator